MLGWDSVQEILRAFGIDATSFLEFAKPHVAKSKRLFDFIPEPRPFQFGATFHHQVAVERSHDRHLYPMCHFKKIGNLKVAPPTLVSLRDDFPQKINTSCAIGNERPGKKAESPMPTGWRVLTLVGDYGDVSDFANIESISPGTTFSLADKASLGKIRKNENPV